MALPTVEVSATRIRENLGLTDKQIHAAAQESMETWQKALCFPSCKTTCCHPTP